MPNLVWGFFDNMLYRPHDQIVRPLYHSYSPHPCEGPRVIHFLEEGKSFRVGLETIVSALRKSGNGLLIAEVLERLRILASVHRGVSTLDLPFPKP